MPRLPVAPVLDVARRSLRDGARFGDGAGDRLADLAEATIAAAARSAWKHAAADGRVTIRLEDLPTAPERPVKEPVDERAAAAAYERLCARLLERANARLREHGLAPVERDEVEAVV